MHPYSYLYLSSLSRQPTTRVTRLRTPWPSEQDPATALVIRAGGLYRGAFQASFFFLLFPQDVALGCYRAAPSARRGWSCESRCSASTMAAHRSLPRASICLASRSQQLTRYLGIGALASLATLLPGKRSSPAVNNALAIGSDCGFRRKGVKPSWYRFPLAVDPC